MSWVLPSSSQEKPHPEELSSAYSLPGSWRGWHGTTWNEKRGKTDSH